MLPAVSALCRALRAIARSSALFPPLPVLFPRDTDSDLGAGRTMRGFGRLAFALVSPHVRSLLRSAPADAHFGGCS